MFKVKVGAAVVAVRSAGGIPTFDAINHFFLINQMIVPGSSYWNIGIGNKRGDVEKDEEGMKTMDDLGRNMAWLIKNLKSNYCIFILKDFVIKMSEKKGRVPMTDKDRGIAFVVLAMSFNIVGLGSLAFGNVSAAAGLLIGSLVFLVFSLFYLTREYRQMRRKKKMNIS